ncbi:MAG TPA: phosphoribosylaminoimidazolecarboxamide formyltransferase [Dictyobacter sp.]|jgi:phosphoribosylaminoimidazolecarboxamide formyltransferase/IMP cyclohydrolase|nr:phosphoribosylaminoimidazolecarboxamide formyltransferase [Dictyobacter sp.]
MTNNELTLRYGCNPHQTPARVSSQNESLPFTVLNGAPGYINLLDAMNSWQLVKELRQVLNMPAAASFKHVSPAGAAVGLPLSDTLKEAYGVADLELSPLATAYARARGADRLCSFGDWAALSDVVDVPTARLISREVSDGVIAPGYEPAALEILRKKQKGRYIVLQIDPEYVPTEVEHREVFGVTFEQKRNTALASLDWLQNVPTQNKELPESAKRDMLISLIALKYTQSNSICFAVDGQTVGIGAGQQSRIHCTRLAASKTAVWYLRQHPRIAEFKWKPEVKRQDRVNAIDIYLQDNVTPAELELWEENFEEVPARLTAEEKREWLAGLQDVVLGSDAFIPFRDSVDCGALYGVKYVAQPGGSLRDDNVIAACDTYGMAMAFTGVRLFHH